MTIPGDIVDNDCDGLIDEELLDGTDINECVSNPCLNGGTCSDKVNSFCTCPHGYADQNCQTELDECQSNPCRNNGTCIDIVNGYYCLCANESSGRHCEQKINSCLSSPCFNDGVCTNQLYGYTCDCLEHWHGDKCEYEIINRTMGCLDIEYSECSCRVNQLKTKTPKSNKALFGTVGFATGLILTLISYCLSRLLNKPKASTKICPENDRSTLLEEPSPVQTEKEEVPKDLKIVFRKQKEVPST
ncbi:NOTCH3 [Mytilus edulis]|uniref:NOTCH3 n=1 Tax=Mytilus edulis TaxID=6550 RepID=A0A8S3UFI9_MYTED|nr:NOTCH3 [Mytilus edulis]